MWGLRNGLRALTEVTPETTRNGKTTPEHVAVDSFRAPGRFEPCRRQSTQLEDPAGSVQLWTKIDDLVFVMSWSAARRAHFRMFEDNRRQLRDFLTPLVG